MTLSRSMKKSKGHKRQCTLNNRSSPTTFIKSLPRDVLVEVVARVASYSFVDLHTMKICCKDFLDASEDKYVWQQVCLDKIPLDRWVPNDKESLFLKRCRESENVESLYREGLQEYFRYPDGNIGGLESLKMAAEKGHKEAKYVYGMILLSDRDDELRKQGLKHIHFLKKFKCVVECRKNVKQLIGGLWKHDGLVKRNLSPLCRSKRTCKGWTTKKNPWLSLWEHEDDDDACEYCRWDCELEFFYNVFNIP